MTKDISLAQRLAGHPAAQIAELLRAFPKEVLPALERDWRFWARPSQLPPDGDWLTWLVLAGRGFGKTRLGAEWVRSCARVPGQRIALVADTAHEARAIMVEGQSGLLSVCSPHERPEFQPSKRSLAWPNGSVASLYSAEDPDGLRGPQHHLAWVDELAKFSAPDALWANLLMGLRLGDHPRVCVTTTPRPIKLLQDLIAQGTTVVTRGSTWANAANLPQVYLEQMKERYAGTRFGAQELEGLLLETVQGALWTQTCLQQCRVEAAVHMERIVVAVDPPVTAHAGSDACGIVVVGRGVDGHAYVLADESLETASPDQWARQAINAYHRYDADRVIAEVNQGGDLVENLLRVHDDTLAYRAVRATRGKILRAEPVAALYERERVHHVGVFAELETEMTQFTQGSSNSPDRMDALVWAISELMLAPDVRPSIRPLRA